MYSTVLEAVLAHAEATPDKVAVADREGRTTYGELAAMIRTAAANLRARGVHKGDRVMLAAVPFVRFVAAYFGCHYIGAVACPADKNAVKDSLLWMRDFLETDAMFYEGPQAGELGFRDLSSLLAPGGADAGPPAELDCEDLADIIFTSATTGKPKGVMWTYNNVLCMVSTTRDIFNASSDTVWLNPSPLHHSAGLRYLFTLLYVGGVLILEDGFSSIKNIYRAIKQNGCAGMNCSPAAIQILYQQTQNKLSQLLRSLKFLSLGGMSLPFAMKEMLVSDLPNTNIYNMYAATEAQAIVGINYSKRRDKLRSVGKPFQGVKAKIVDSGLQNIASNENNIGRLAIYSGTVMKGYWNDQKRTEEVIADNWLIMGDMAYLDEDGYIYLVGRADDVINCGGEKISPFEIEETVCSFEGIKECCCIGVDDPRGILGKVPVAFIVLENNAPYSEQQLSDHLNHRLDNYKLPYAIIAVDEIPKNSVGKYLHRELIRIWAERK